MGNACNKQKDASIFPKEEAQLKYGNVIWREIKVIDQYSPELDSVKELYQTSCSICGYVTIAIAPTFPNLVKLKATYESVLEVITNLQSTSYVETLLESPMSFIRESRKTYIENNKDEFGKEIDIKSYIKDWVATYEMSDYLRQIKEVPENLVFLRQVAWDHPENVMGINHEEAIRVKEELPFKGQGFFIETFAPTRRLWTVAEWMKNCKKDLKKANKPLVVIADLLGHFVTCLCFELIRGTQTKKTVLLLDSTTMRYLDPMHDYVYRTVTALAF
eukprot:TRINITY_DN908_c0_g1_i1.p1 TRINITY_DN908_c0_g1~~TRINITY_DN908_c0_g1_i1.p1  ORF type:complete len:275 (-),score=30.48 TRINITY_DN908_c0_g1_i1:158-982(-)